MQPPWPISNDADDPFRLQITEYRVRPGLDHRSSIQYWEPPVAEDQMDDALLSPGDGVFLSPGDDVFLSPGDDVFLSPGDDMFLSLRETDQNGPAQKSIPISRYAGKLAKKATYDEW